MPNVWNIGNTTVRNPKRIENALKVFLEEGFSGNAKGSEVERRLHAKLKQRNVLEFEGEPSDWNGRKWRAAFYQLGFVSYEEYNICGDRIPTKEMFQKIGIESVDRPFQLTPSGHHLITSLSIPEIEEIYTRQFCCYELPNSLESGFPADSKMKPFILFIQVLKLLQDQGLAGLTKYETGLFIQKFRNHTPDLAKIIFEEVIQFRSEISKCISSKEEKIVRNRYKNQLAEFSGIDPNSVVRDYSDTTFRYFSLSGLFTFIGDSIAIRQNKRHLVEELIKKEPFFLYNTDPLRYFFEFYTNTHTIPTDNVDIALREIEFLKKGVKDLANPLLKEANQLTSNSAVGLIQKVRYALIEYNNWEREEDYAAEQQNPRAIEEILSYLKFLNNKPVSVPIEIDDKPAYLEWAVWRSFLAINEIRSPIHQTRRFPVDEDFKPRNTAPGGGADLIFEFENYVLAVEVTLTLSHRQMAVESEPVRRHVVDYKDVFPDKDVYCLFIAPQLDNNVVETFRIGVWYDGDNEEFMNIIPMELNDFSVAIEILLRKRFTNDQFKNLLDRCLIYRNVRAPQWKSYISKEVMGWRDRLTHFQNA
jgi:hypothetical protein